MKNELKNLTHMISMMMRRFENYTSLPIAHDSGSHPSVPQNEIHIVQNQNVPTPSVHINIPQSIPSFGHLDAPQYKDKISAWVDKEAKEKIEELERQLKQIKGTDSLGSLNFNDLCMHPGLNSPPNSNVQTLRNITEKSS